MCARAALCVIRAERSGLSSVIGLSDSKVFAGLLMTRPSLA